MKMMKNTITTANILIMSHRFEVMPLKYFKSSVCAASTLVCTSSTLRSILWQQRNKTSIIFHSWWTLSPQLAPSPSLPPSLPPLSIVVPPLHLVIVLTWQPVLLVPWPSLLVVWRCFLILLWWSECSPWLQPSPGCMHPTKQTNYLIYI